MLGNLSMPDSKKKTPAFLRYKTERHREHNKLKRIWLSSGSSAAADWARAHGCLDLFDGMVHK